MLNCKEVTDILPSIAVKRDVLENIIAQIILLLQTEIDALLTLFRELHPLVIRCRSISNDHRFPVLKAANPFHLWCWYLYGGNYYPV